MRDRATVGNLWKSHRAGVSRHGQRNFFSKRGGFPISGATFPICCGAFPNFSTPAPIFPATFPNVKMPTPILRMAFPNFSVPPPNFPTIFPNYFVVFPIFSIAPPIFPRVFPIFSAAKQIYNGLIISYLRYFCRAKTAKNAKTGQILPFSSLRQLRSLRATCFSLNTSPHN